jgi:shikimate dehydrogenase
MPKGAVSKAGVIGFPIAHSLSPRIHGYWLKEHGLKGSYEAIEVKAEELEAFLKSLAENGYKGINITLPHKETALPLMDAVEPIARAIGAINTVVVRGGKLYASNTDMGGFFENLAEGAPGFEFHKGKAVVLGAGGAAKAIVAALLIYGVPEVVVANRTALKAQHLKDHFRQATGEGDIAARIDWEKLSKKITVVEWAERSQALKGANMLVNTTVLGMKGQAPLELDLKHLPKTALVNDIVYRPLETRLLKDARKHGNRVVDGLGMLLHQAVPGFEAWFGVRPAVTPALRRHVLEGVG